MHFEILVEDQSGKKALGVLVPEIVGKEHTVKIYAYKGIGRIPKNMRGPNDPSKRLLLENLPKLLRGYGKTFRGYTEDYPAAVIVVCDLDRKCLITFRQEMLDILNACNPKPNTRFCFAIEEGEAWFLGDLNAIKSAYPKAKDAVLNSYINDSICGTWEKLADAVYPGGASALFSGGWQAVGAEKSKWAERIPPFMDIMNNQSPSFCHFCTKLRELAGVA
ncbi:MAG TPA: hypothetical protein PLG59_08440 [bacterium]|nr:hypothetical protein [bacterium]HQP99844.1 hypothetical protein [bacterium]